MALPLHISKHLLRNWIILIDLLQQAYMISCILGYKFRSLLRNNSNCIYWLNNCLELIVELGFSKSSNLLSKLSCIRLANRIQMELKSMRILVVFHNSFPFLLQRHHGQFHWSQCAMSHSSRLISSNLYGKDLHRLNHRFSFHLYRIDLYLIRNLKVPIITY